MKYLIYSVLVTGSAPEIPLTPQHWECRRLKFIASCNDEFLPETTDPDYEIVYVDISSVDLVKGITATENHVFEEAPSRARRIVRRGDTIVSTVRTYLKAIATIKSPPANMIVSTGFAVLRPLPFIDSRFLGYALQSTAFVEKVVAHSTGVSYPAINPSTLVCLPVSYPKNREEQRKIADFLEWKSAQIDALISRKQALIEKLKEERLAVITQTVTKGLDPSVPGVDSAVPWLGEIPATWAVVPLGFLVSILGGMTPSMAVPEYWKGEVPWVTPKDMKVPRIEDSQDRITERALSETGISLVPVDSILIVVRGMILAHSFPTAINLCEVTINQDMKALVCCGHLLPEYLYWCLTGFEKVLSDLAAESAHGTRKMETMVLKKFRLPVPPTDEQSRIVETLKRRLHELDSFANSVRKSIDRYTEYRTALITATTTGQIDVRGVAVPAEFSPR